MSFIIVMVLMYLLFSQLDKMAYKYKGIAGYVWLNRMLMVLFIGATLWLHHTEPTTFHMFLIVAVTLTFAGNMIKYNPWTLNKMVIAEKQAKENTDV